MALATRPAAAAVEEKSLLAPDGTMYQVRSGNTAELNLPTFGPYGLRPDDNVIQWSTVQQDGTKTGGVIPGTASSSIKRNLDLSYDELTGSLILLWKEEVSLLNVLRLGILRSDGWTTSDLVPNLGFPHAYNPQMLLSHQTAHYQDADGTDKTRVRSILSVIWWEESGESQARYAPLFLDDDSGATDVQIYNLASVLGTAGTTSGQNVAQAAYMFPKLRLDGPNGEIAASFADLAAGKQLVVRITFPEDLGKPSVPGNVSWMRRRIPVVGAKFTGPLPGGDSLPGKKVAVTTLIGPSYMPTLLWTGDKALNYVRFEGKSWSRVRSIPITDDLPYDRALRLLEDMAGRN